MASREVEIERKYDVDPDTALPELHEVDGVAKVERPEAARLEATYFDTRELSLVGAGITLRRRVGGDDQGWHLKLPGASDSERTELHLPLARGIRTVPHELRSLLRGVAGIADDDTLRAVARLRTTRTTRLLRDADGRALAEVCDDEVEARVFRTVDHDEAREHRWREWEVELADGDETVLDAVEQALLAAGATPAEHSSKLRRALGEAAPQPLTTPDDLVDHDRPMPTPREVVQARLTEQAQRVIALDPEVRRDTPDAVHQMRVAARRLRSALATYRPMLRREVTEPLREDLRHLGRLLGEARDLEVLDERLTGLLAEQGWADHPFAGHLTDELRRDRGRALAEVLAGLDDERHQRLLSGLQELAEQAPWSDELDWAEVLRRVRKDDKRLRRRMSRAERTESHRERLHLLHEARKAAKRLRYAAETLVPSHGSDADRLARSAKSLQSHLGDLQDAVVSRERVAGIAGRAEEAGIATFPAGVVWAREDEEIRSLEAEVPETWRTAKRKKRRAWLRS